jgi:phosphate starvation-inducible PhoH-like protein
MLITRIGQNSKMVLTGDIHQSDLSRHLQGGFLNIIESLDGLEGIGVAKLDSSDIVRNAIIGRILSRLDQLENGNTQH